MAKLTQAEVKQKADEWADIQAQIVKAENAKGKQLEPFIEKFNEETKAITEKHDAKIQKLEAQRDGLQTEVLTWLHGQGRPLTVAGEKAIAVVEKKIGSRVVDVQKFFDSVKEKNAAFWACVSVAIKKAEDLVGKEKVDAISVKDSKLVAALKLK